MNAAVVWSRHGQHLGAVLLGLACLLNAGCVSGPSPVSPPAPVPAPQAGPGGAAVGAAQAAKYVAPTAGAAALALLAQARAQAQQGDGEQAAATLERAIRIEPGNPWLWHRLAVLRLQLGEPEQAIELATKSNTLASVSAAGNRRLQGGNWQVIGAARTQLGQHPGAADANARAGQILE